jgi:peptidylprolyl isomerase
LPHKDVKATFVEITPSKMKLYCMKKLSLLFLFLLPFAFLSLAQTKKAAPKKPEAKHTTVTKPSKKEEKPIRVEISTEFGSMYFKLYNETPLHRDNFVKLIKQGFYDSLLFHRVIKSFMIQGGDPTSKYADSNAMLGSGDVGYKVPAEFNPALFHKRGALAAARDNNPQQMSSGCQFYIVQGRKFTTQELEQMINTKNLNRKQEILYQIYQTDSVQTAVNNFQKAGGDREQLRLYMDQLQKVVDQVYEQKYPNADKVNMDQIQTYVEFGGAPHLDGAYTVFGEMESGFEVLDIIANQATLPGDRPISDIRMKIRILK